MAQNQPSLDAEFGEEYKVIKSDIKKVVLINFLIIVLLVGLFFLDRQFGILTPLQKFF